jgi:amino acid transporter
MIFSIVLNGLMGFAFMLTLLFCIGDLESVLSTPTGYPYMQIFLNATGSTKTATVMTVAMVLLACLATMGVLTPASRTVWALAADGGIPFAGFFAQASRNCPAP